MTLDNSTAFARNYLAICERKMIEKASGQSVLPFDY
jgi:hypothetical protein